MSELDNKDSMADSVLQRTSRTTYHITEIAYDIKTQRDNIYHLSSFTSLAAANAEAHRTFHEDIYLDDNIDKLLKYEVYMTKNERGESLLNAVARFDGWRVRVGVVRVEDFESTAASASTPITGDATQGSFATVVYPRHRRAAVLERRPKNSEDYDKVLTALARLDPWGEEGGLVMEGEKEEAAKPGEKRKRVE